MANYLSVRGEALPAVSSKTAKSQGRKHRRGRTTRTLNPLIAYDRDVWPSLTQRKQKASKLTQKAKPKLNFENTWPFRQLAPAYLG